MYYFSLDFKSREEAIECRDKWMGILESLEDGDVKDKVQQDIWDLDDYIARCE